MSDNTDLINKIKALGGDDLSNLTEDHIKQLSKEITKKPKKKSKKKKNIPKADPTEDSYQVTLKYCNGILKNIGMDPITKLEEFVDVPRDKIISEDNKKLLKSMEKEIFACYRFHKTLCNWTKDSPTKQLNILRYLVKNVGYNLISQQDRKYNNNTMVRQLIYSVVA